MSGSGASFLKEFVSKPHQIGAIAPSSPSLARRLVEGIDWTRIEVAVEYGPGDGAVTVEVLRQVRSKTFFAIESNEVYADTFARRFPDVRLYLDSAVNVAQICRVEGVERIDFVLSSLPWANFSDGLQDRILDATLDVLAPNGQFSTFAYMHGLALPSGRRFRQKLMTRFGTVERSAVVWRNAPPAIVYWCSR